MQTTKRARFFDAMLRIVFCSLATILIVMTFYCAGWMLAGVSGMILSPFVTSVSGKDYSHELLHTFPIGGKVLGVIIGLWFCKGFFTTPTPPAAAG